MKNIFRVLFLMLFLGLFPLACENDYDPGYDCGFGVAKPFEIIGLEPVVFQIVKRKIITDSFRIYPNGLADSLVYYDNYEIGLALKVSGTKVVSARSLSLSLFSTEAYACSPARLPYFNKFINISIRATDTATYPSTRFIKKGEDITDSFDFFIGESDITWLSDTIYRLGEKTIDRTEYPFLFVPRYHSKQRIKLPLEIEVVTEDSVYTVGYTLRLD